MSVQNSNRQAAIGLEVHVQLKSCTKLFSRQSTQRKRVQPNQNANLVDLAYPGTLPVFNQSVLTKAIQFGLAIDAPIAKTCTFDRKNYFYPDLPKGYQITQFSQPIVGAGLFNFWLREGRSKCIRIRQAHLEEDAGRSIHDRFPDRTALDFNRAGVPLLEIVSEPDLTTPAEAAACFRQLHALVVWLDLCDGKLSEGAVRCDANISIHSPANGRLGVPTEIKNLNSFKFLEKALCFEIERQSKVLAEGKDIHRETRLFDPTSGKTKPLRCKEIPDEYRYLPDPDLPPISIDEDLVSNIARRMPELPMSRRERFINDFGLTAATAYRLTLKRPLANLFEDATRLSGDPRRVANLIFGELTALAKLDPSCEIQNCISAEQIADLVRNVQNGTISSSVVKELLGELWNSNLDVEKVIQKHDLTQISDDGKISTWVEDVLNGHRHLIPQLLDGETKLYEYLVGAVMKNSCGKANPQQVRKILENKIFASKDPYCAD